MDRNSELARELGTILTNQKAKVATAESLTGGLIAATMTEIPGSGSWFAAGLVTYSSEQKTLLLNVAAELIQRHGVVSKECVEAMALNACRVTHSQYAVAVSGEAGPSAQERDVGDVWFAWAKDGRVWSRKHHFSGDRTHIREATVQEAITGLINLTTGLIPDFN